MSSRVRALISDFTNCASGRRRGKSRRLPNRAWSSVVQVAISSPTKANPSCTRASRAAAWRPVRRRPGRTRATRPQRTHHISANLIHMWLTQFDRGELSSEEAEASVIAEYEAKIAALERKVGQLTMELDLVKKTPRPPHGASNERSSIVTGPVGALSDGGARP